MLAVLGLDNRPQARAQFRRVPPREPGQAAGTGGAAVAPTSYTPPQVAELYEFPAGTDGTGQTLAIIELGGGFGGGDLDPYFGGLGLPVPSVTAASVDGRSTSPARTRTAPTVRCCWTSRWPAVAPGAAQVVYFAPNTDRGFVDAVTTAVHATPTPTAISISWGQSEDAWTAQARTALDQAMADAAALGVTVRSRPGTTAAATARRQRAHVDFPASSPHALACGGTSLHGDAAPA